AAGRLEPFRRYPEDFRVKLWIERSDYESCIHRRCQQLHAAGVLPSPVPDDLDDVASYKFNAQRCRVIHCHYLLDIVACLIGRAREDALTNAELDRDLRRAPRLLDRIL